MDFRSLARSLAVAALALLFLAPSLGAQEETDPLQTRFDAALQVFRSADQYDSIELFTALIGELEGRDELSDAARNLLARSYFHRAEAHYNFGDNAEAATDLESAIRVEPNLVIDETMISPKLAELLAESRRKVVGFLQSEVQPRDAVAHVEGAPPLYVGEAIALLDGEYTVRIERPGYQTVERTVRVPAGQTTNLRVELARTSAVLHVLTETPGIDVVVDGREAGTTEDDGSGIGALAVDGLEPGSHTIELSSRGYRERKLEVELAGLDDYSTDVITLEAMRGSVRLAGLLPQSVVLINGEEQSRPAGDTASFDVPAGDNVVEVDYRGVGRFVREIEVADGQAIGLEVELRPVIAVLGVLGADEVSARELQEGVHDFFRRSDAWTVIDESEAGAQLVASNGFDVGRFREIGMASPTQIARVDWKPLQQACDRRIGASAYLIGVLSDDLFASSADLWILPAEPHAALPQKVRSRMGNRQLLTEALEPLSRRPRFERPWLGMRLIETNAASGLVVLNVTTGSPAASAGLEPGELVSAVGGEPIDRLAQLEAVLREAEPHTPLELTVTRPDGSRTVSVTLGSSPGVLPWTDPDTFYPLYLAWLEIEQVTGRSELEPWLVQLNQASAFMGLGSWEEAIRLLRSIDAPEGGGVGQAMVDYWLGLALMRTDPATYRDIALAALSRAESAEAARLYHNDGPLLAPLAAAGKKMLAGGG